MYAIGIDGGGTKTTAVLIDEQGTVHAYAKAGASNPNGVGFPQTEKEIKKLLKELEKQAPSVFDSVDSLFAGMSGVDREPDKIRMRELFRKHLRSSCLVTVENDAVNALFSGTLGKPGVVHISGTGSITFGINSKGERGRTGGWGYLLGDEGSGFSIGRKVLTAVFNEYDGFGNPTLLTDLVLEKENLEEVSALVPLVYQNENPREKIASFSRLAVKAAEKGDAEAQSILLNAGKEMGTNLLHLIQKLFLEETKEIPIVLAGGVYHNAEWYIPAIKGILSKLPIKTNLILPILPPEGGSALTAMRALDEKAITSETEKRIAAQLAEIEQEKNLTIL